MGKYCYCVSMSVLHNAQELCHRIVQGGKMSVVLHQCVCICVLFHSFSPVSKVSYKFMKVGRAEKLDFLCNALLFGIAL
jgi:hypothetical protein